jgi:DNA-binding beta-propeller fold protein YncE
MAIKKSFLNDLLSVAGINLAAAMFTLAAFWLFSTPSFAAIDCTYVYNLSNFSGKVPFNWANIAIDEDRKEVYVADPEERDIRVFNDSGMEIYRFGDDDRFGTVMDVAVKKDGNILVLAKRASELSIILCNFRGDPLSEFAVKGMPIDFSTFTPNRIICRNDLMYFVDSNEIQIVVTDQNGIYTKGYHLKPLLAVDEKKLGGAEIGGFSVDGQGNMLFTVPEVFLAFILSPEGRIQNFGSPGSAPGKFSLIGGITADDKGYIYVADRGKNVIIVFDRQFQFQSEFGYRGSRPENLVGPENLGFYSGKGMLYVSQLRNRGISVFRIDYSR